MASVLLAATRPLSPAFLAVIMVVVALVAGRTKLRRIWADRRSRVAAAVIVAVTALSTAYVVINHSLVVIQVRELAE